MSSVALPTTPSAAMSAPPCRAQCDPRTRVFRLHSATIACVPARLLVSMVLVAAAVLAAGCGSEGESAPKAPVAFCRAASNYDDRLSRGAKVPEQIRLEIGRAHV